MKEIAHGGMPKYFSPENMISSLEKKIKAIKRMQRNDIGEDEGEWYTTK